MKIPLIIVLLSSIAALAFAYTAEHVYGLLPCILCIYQRIPYFINIFLVPYALILNNKLKLVLLVLCAISYLSGGLIASYHVLVEKGVIKLETSCEQQGESATTIEEIRNQLIGKPAAPCEKPQFVFLGVSMAGWNALFSFLMCFYVIYGLRKNFKTYVKP